MSNFTSDFPSQGKEKLCPISPLVFSGFPSQGKEKLHPILPLVKENSFLPHLSWIQVEPHALTLLATP